MRLFIDVCMSVCMIVHGCVFCVIFAVIPICLFSCMPHILQHVCTFSCAFKTGLYNLLHFFVSCKWFMRDKTLRKANGCVQYIDKGSSSLLKTSCLSLSKQHPITYFSDLGVYILFKMSLRFSD